MVSDFRIYDIPALFIRCVLHLAAVGIIAHMLFTTGGWGCGSP